MSKYDGLEGTKFYRWSILEDAGRLNGHKMYTCECECGTVKNIYAYLLFEGNSRQSKSCGCLKKELLKARFTTHGQGGKNRTKAYNSWHKMMQRCTNPNESFYYRYGGNGIEVCKEWHDFKKFFEDMGECPPNHTIERINVNKGYSKENCKWADVFEQAQNKGVTARNTSGVVGVNYVKSKNRWESRIRHQNKVYRLGYFKTLEEAKQARLDAELKYFGRIINGGQY